MATLLTFNLNSGFRHFKTVEQSSFSRFLMIAHAVSQHVDLKQKKTNITQASSAVVHVLFLGYAVSCCTHTSYFWLANWYCSSNFSASSWYIHSHSSLAFSLRGTVEQLWDNLHDIKCAWNDKRRCMWHDASPPTWACLDSSSRCPEICVFRSGSSSSSLSPSVSYHSVSLSAGIFKRFMSLAVVTSWRPPPTLNPRLTHQLLHVAPKVEAGQGFLLLCVILCPPLGLLLLLPSSLILENNETREEDEDQESNAVSCVDYIKEEHVFTSRRFWRSFSRSLRILCCSARSERRFSWNDRSSQVNTAVVGIGSCSIGCRALTILSLRWMISSSSFFLLSKWTSISVWSSIRSFSILLRCMSYRSGYSSALWCVKTHTHIYLWSQKLKGRLNESEVTQGVSQFENLVTVNIILWNLRLKPV